MPGYWYAKKKENAKQDGLILMKVDALLLDIDGVLVVGDQTVPGAPEAIRWLIDQGIPYRYISNSTQRSRKEIAERLRKAGVTISIDQLQTPVVAALSLLEEKVSRHAAS